MSAAATLHSVLRFNAWMDDSGPHAAGLPDGALTALHQSGILLAGKLGGIQDNMEQIRSLWQKLQEHQAGSIPVMHEGIPEPVQRLAVELYNLQIGASLMQEEASVMQSRLQEAAPLMQAAEAAGAAGLQETLRRLEAAEAELDAQKEGLAKVKSDLKGAGNLADSLLPGDGGTIVVPEALQAANDAVGAAYDTLNRLAAARNAASRSAEAREKGRDLLQELGGIAAQLQDLASALDKALGRFAEASKTQPAATAAPSEIVTHYVRNCSEALVRLLSWAEEFFGTGGSPGIARMMAALSGNYECHDYDGSSGRNDWHYVQVSLLGGRSALWRNRAGVSWVLNFGPDEHQLLVGSDCPYYSDYKEARLHWSGAELSGISGPYKELYRKV